MRPRGRWGCFRMPGRSGARRTDRHRVLRNGQHVTRPAACAPPRPRDAAASHRRPGTRRVPLRIVVPLGGATSAAGDSRDLRPRGLRSSPWASYEGPLDCSASKYKETNSKQLLIHEWVAFHSTVPRSSARGRSVVEFQ